MLNQEAQMIQWCADFDNLAEAPLLNQERGQGRIVLIGKSSMELGFQDAEPQAQSLYDEEKPQLLCQEAQMSRELSNYSYDESTPLNQEAHKVMDLLRALSSYSYRTAELKGKKNREELTQLGPPLNQDEQFVNRCGAFYDKAQQTGSQETGSQERQLVVRGHNFGDELDAKGLKPPYSQDSFSFQSLSRGHEKRRDLVVRRQRQQEAWWETKMSLVDLPCSGKINRLKTFAYFLVSSGFEREALELSAMSAHLWDNEDLFRSIKNSRYTDEQLSRISILCGKMADDGLLAKRMQQLFSYGHEPMCRSHEEALAGLNTLIVRGFVETLQVIHSHYQHLQSNGSPGQSLRVLPEIILWPSKTIDGSNGGPGSENIIDLAD